MANNQRDQQQNRAGIWKQLLVLFFIAAVVLCLQIIVISSLSFAVVQKYRMLIQFSAAILLFLCVAAAVIVLLREKYRVYRTIFSGLLLWLFFLSVLGVAEWTDFTTILQSPELYHDFLLKTGAYMPYIYIALQVVQVLFLPLPGVLSILVGIQLFGAFFAALYSFIGSVGGSLVAFWVGRKWGYKAVEWIVGKDVLEQWQERIKGKDNLLLTAMFFLPFFPDDILCFVAGVSTMTTRYFCVMIVLSRAVAVFSTAYSVAFIPIDTWWGMTIWVLIALLMLLLFIFIYKNMDKIQEKIYQKKKKE